MLPTVSERLLARYLLNTPVSLTQAISTHFLLFLEYLIISQNRWKVALVSDRWIPFPLFCARKFSCVGRIFVGPCDRGVKVWYFWMCLNLPPNLTILVFHRIFFFSFFITSNLFFPSFQTKSFRKDRILCPSNQYVRTYWSEWLLGFLFLRV